MSGNEFRFFLSGDINLLVIFKIERLEGKLVPSDADNSLEERKPELYVECLLYIDGAPLGLPVRTRLESIGPSYCWNELITLSAKYRDLTANSQLAITACTPVAMHTMLLQFVLTRIKYGPARYWAILFVFCFLVFGIWASRTHVAHPT